MALRKLMGQNFRVFEGTAVVIGETSCQVTIQGNMEDESNKDTVSSYNKESMVTKQWSAQTESNDITLQRLRGYINAFNSDNKLNVGWDETNGTGNADASNADFARSGQAILNDLNISANNRQVVRLTMQYQGSGPLA